MANNQTSLKKSRAEAEALVRKIALSYDSVYKAEEELKDLLVRLDCYKDKENEISDVYKSIKSSLDNAKADKENIEDLLNKAKDNYTEISSFIDETFDPIKERIEDEDDGIQACLDDYTDKWEDIIERYDKIKDAHISIISLKSEYDEYLGKIKKIKKEYEELDDIIFDENDGIEVTNSYIKGIKSQVDDLYGKIEKTHRDSVDSLNSIIKLEDKSVAKFKTITNIETDALRLHEKIKEVYGIATVNGQGGYFDITKEELIKYREKWMGFLLIILILTVVAASLITAMTTELEIVKNEIVNILIRYSILSPLIYGIIFCSKQFKLARLAVDHYTYKTVVSFSLENEIVFLQDKFGKDEPEILEFALSNLEKLYSEPFQSSQKEFENKLELLKQKQHAKDVNKKLKARMDLIKHGFTDNISNGSSHINKLVTQEDVD